MAELLTWNDVRAGTWNGARYTWNEAQLIAEIQNIGGRAGATKRQIKKTLNQQPEEKKERIVKLIAKIQGVEYKQEKPRKNKKIKITVEDVEVLVKELNINVHV